jgi:hypothetical protein
MMFISSVKTAHNSTIKKITGLHSPNFLGILSRFTKPLLSI